MILFELKSSNSSALFGTPENPTPKDDITIIAQKPDCSSFLVLSNTAYPELDQFVSFDGFDFTYCQAWGLTINAEVVARVIQDLRKNAYPPMADYLDGIAKGDQAQVDKYVADCLAVKAKYPK